MWTVNQFHFKIPGYLALYPQRPQTSFIWSPSRRLNPIFINFTSRKIKLSLTINKRDLKLVNVMQVFLQPIGSGAFPWMLKIRLRLLSAERWLLQVTPWEWLHVHVHLLSCCPNFAGMYWRPRCLCASWHWLNHDSHWPWWLILTTLLFFLDFDFFIAGT